MTPVLKQALEKSAKKCSSCKETGRPLQSRKISFNKILTSFNHHVQLDFFFCAEYENQSIFHMVDVHTAYSAASLMSSREMSQVAHQLAVKWINVHGAPLTMSGEVEFFNTRFSDALRYFDIKFEPLPALLHNKPGVVERNNVVVRVLIQRGQRLKDSAHFSRTRSEASGRDEILSRAVYLSNILYGIKTLSSFEMTRGYTPALVGLPQIKLSAELITAHTEQVARRALRLLENTNQPHVLKPEHIVRGELVYFFKRGPKSGCGKERRCALQRRIMSSFQKKQDHSGNPIRAAYEDLRQSPFSPFLTELDKIDFIFPRSYSVVDED